MNEMSIKHKGLNRSIRRKQRETSRPFAKIADGQLTYSGWFWSQISRTIEWHLGRVALNFVLGFLPPNQKTSCVQTYCNIKGFFLQNHDWNYGIDPEIKQSSRESLNQKNIILWNRL